MIVEKKAGAGAGWRDEEYRAAGATMVDDGATVWAEADLVYKVKEPMTWEYDLMRPGQVLFAFLHLCKVIKSEGPNMQCFVPIGFYF